MDPKFFYYKPSDKIPSIKIAFELIDNPMIEELTCSICFELFDKPRQTEECNHRFCKRCINKFFGLDCWVKNCPLCRTIIYKTSLKSDSFVESIMSKLNVKCCEENCMDVFTINDIKKHIDNDCEYATRQCKFNCGKVFIKKNINEHEDGCFRNPTVEINCENCDERIFAINLDEHNKKTCLEALVFCNYGCEDKIKRKDLKIHNDDFSKIHADIMLKKYEILHEKFIEKDKNVKVLQEKFDNVIKYMKTISPPDYEDIDSFEHYEHIHKGFGNYEYYMSAYRYTTLIKKINNMLTDK
jgi:hypothetical protein